MIKKILTKWSILSLALLIAPLTTHAADLSSKPKYTFQKKNATYAIAYAPLFGAYGEVKVYQGLSVLAGFYTAPQSLNLAYERQHASWTTLYLGARYYLTGVPIRHGLFLQYSLAAKALSLHEYPYKIQRAIIAQNTISLGYRYAEGHIFCDFGAGVSSNFIFTKNPNDYGNIQTHIFTPDLILSLGYSF